MGKLTARLQEAVNYLDDYLRDRAKALDHEKSDALNEGLPILRTENPGS